MTEQSQGPWRIGIVCPYAFDVPGGVQFHIRDFAEALIERGHYVSVLAPAEDESDLPDFVVGAGGSIPIPFNGSVARLSFGPRVNRRVVKWLEEGDFDLLHVHEPLVPSVSMLSVSNTSLPVVATFHSAQESTRALRFFGPALQAMLEKVTVSIAVSEAARKTIEAAAIGHHVIIPNGVYVETFRNAQPREEWSGIRHGGPATICFLGRLDEPRKGLPIFAEAATKLLAADPQLRVLIAGMGEAGAIREKLKPWSDRVRFLGSISEEDKAALFASADVYVAPQTGGESFGIVLVEAMAGGAAVVASNIDAFVSVLNGGDAGTLFEVNNPDSLVEAIREALTKVEDGEYRTHADQWVTQYDWSQVANAVLQVYAVVLADRPAADSEKRRKRFLPWRRKGER